MFQKLCRAIACCLPTLAEINTDTMDGVKIENDEIVALRSSGVGTSLPCRVTKLDSEAEGLQGKFLEVSPIPHLHAN